MWAKFEWGHCFPKENAYSLTAQIKLFVGSRTQNNIQKLYYKLIVSPKNKQKNVKIMIKNRFNNTHLLQKKKTVDKLVHSKHKNIKTFTFITKRLHAMQMKNADVIQV